jgi:hypothetical protein
VAGTVVVVGDGAVVLVTVGPGAAQEARPQRIGTSTAVA